MGGGAVVHNNAVQQSAAERTIILQHITPWLMVARSMTVLLTAATAATAPA
jgi:hypothetical protein